jgi:hypothetical protein
MTTTTFGQLCFRSLRMLGMLVALTLTLASPAARGATIGSLLYGIDDAGSIYEINPAEQSSTLVKTGASTSLANSLAYDGAREQLLFVNKDLDLQFWDRTSGSVTSLGNPLSLTADPGNAAYYQDAYWYFDTNSTVLHKASLTYAGNTPSVDSISSFSIAGMAATGDNTNTFGDIAIDTAQGILYASTSRGRFYSIDLADPENSFTQIAASLGSDRSVGLQLSFSADNNTLYGHRYADGTWYTINPATGAATEIAGFITIPAGGVGFRDLGGAAAVPEPSTLALAGIGLVGGLAHQVRRRRLRTAA